MQLRNPTPPSNVSRLSLGGCGVTVFTKLSEKAAELAGHYLAFVMATLFILLWGISGPLFSFSDTWQLVVNTSTTIVTFLMVFLIQNAQNREASATQAKLDEILNIVSTTKSETIGAEHLPLDKLKAILKHLEAQSETTSTNNPE
ncbi:low affinity iron permease family protein [Ochrobactrum tritici]|uniref:Low affinity iron permease family protein n=1 Tax=Brucella tritici TaxID=94626 RepID=A0A7X6FQI0_9HYPH|nr:low affinity iron permease family protein [Brucella tritici]